MTERLIPPKALLLVACGSREHRILPLLTALTAVLFAIATSKRKV